MSAMSLVGFATALETQRRRRREERDSSRDDGGPLPLSGDRIPETADLRMRSREREREGKREDEAERSACAFRELKRCGADEPAAVGVALPRPLPRSCQRQKEAQSQIHGREEKRRNEGALSDESRHAGAVEGKRGGGVHRGTTAQVKRRRMCCCGFRLVSFFPSAALSPSMVKTAVPLTEADVL